MIFERMGVKVSVSFYIILNETAGNGRAKGLWPEIKAILDQRQLSYQLTRTQYPGHASELARQFAKQASGQQLTNSVVLAIGGDGTLHETLNGLISAHLNTPIPIACLPVGLNNNFAKGLNMATNWRAALDQIINCTTKNTVTIGTYTDTSKQTTGAFTNNVGIGFDAAVVNSANSTKTKSILSRLHLNKLRILAAIIGVCYNQTAFPMTVHVGRHRDMYPKAYLVTIANHPYFGNGLKVVPSASISEPALDLIVIEKKHLPQLIYIGFMILLGKHLKLKAVHHYHEPKLHLVVPAIEYGQTDGEELGGRYWDTYFESTTYPFWIDPTI